MAKIEVTKNYEIDSDVGETILDNHFNRYDTYVKADDGILFEDLDIKNSIIFLEEVKEQLIDAMDYIIKKYKQAEEYGKENEKLDYHKVVSLSYL